MFGQHIHNYETLSIFDLNDANNNNGFKLRETKIQFWDIAPAVIDWIVELSINMGIQRDELRELFYEVADQYKGFPFPLTTDDAWKRFGEALTEYDAMAGTRGDDAEGIEEDEEKGNCHELGH